MKRALNIFRHPIAVIAMALSLPGWVSAESLNLGEGLLIEAPSPDELIYQAIPSFDANRKMLQHRNGEQLHYFISVNRLPRGSIIAQRYFDRLLQDLEAASGPQTLEVLDQGQYQSRTGLYGSYIEYSFVPNGSDKRQHQIAHFLTNTNRAFVAIAVLVDDNALENMRDSSLSAFKTASISSNPITTTTAVSTAGEKSGAGSR